MKKFKLGFAILFLAFCFNSACAMEKKENLNNLNIENFEKPLVFQISEKIKEKIVKECTVPKIDSINSEHFKKIEEAILERLNSIKPMLNTGKCMLYLMPCFYKEQNSKQYNLTLLMQKKDNNIVVFDVEWHPLDEVNDLPRKLNERIVKNDNSFRFTTEQEKQLKEYGVADNRIKIFEEDIEKKLVNTEKYNAFFYNTQIEKQGKFLNILICKSSKINYVVFMRFISMSKEKKRQICEHVRKKEEAYAEERRLETEKLNKMAQRMNFVETPPMFEFDSKLKDAILELNSSITPHQMKEIEHSLKKVANNVIENEKIERARVRLREYSDELGTIEVVLTKKIFENNQIKIIPQVNYIPKSISSAMSNISRSDSENYSNN